MDKNRENKEITTNELAAIIKAGFEASDKRTDAKFEAADKRTDAKIESLAKMVANGFNNLGEKIEALKEGQERIEMRLNNVVYRTEQARH